MFFHSEQLLYFNMNKQRLKEIMLDQKEVFNRPRNLIERDIDLEMYIATSQVVVISGIRRCGKSSLLFLLKEKMGLTEEKYCYFNFDDERITPEISILENIVTLHIEIYGTFPALFLDEIQNIPGWEKFINRMYEQGTKAFITGSNARLLSSEIATSLTGRNKVIELYPFSFSEYLRFLQKEYNLGKLTPAKRALMQKDFNEYLEIGGFPLVVRENDLELINSYYQDILYRDIVSRYRLSQVNELKELGLYFAANIGKLFSYATLQKISGIKSLSSIKEYLDYFRQSYLYYYLPKFDYSVKKQIMNPKKVYAIDPGFANRLGFRFSEDRGRLIENVVFNELLRRGHEVYYHSGKYECDFVLKTGTEVVGLIQVTDRLHHENTAREINGLKEAMQLYKQPAGLLLVNDPVTEFLDMEKDVSIQNVEQWLLEK